MTQPRVTRPRSAAARLAGIGLLAVGVAAAIYLAGRLLTPDYAFGLFGQAGLGAVMLKSLLATIAFGAAIVQVLLALWMYRRLPLAGRPPRAGTGWRTGSSASPCSRSPCRSRCTA